MDFDSLHQKVNAETDDYHEMRHFFLRELVMLKKLKDQPYFQKFLTYSDDEDTCKLNIIDNQIKKNSSPNALKSPKT